MNLYFVQHGQAMTKIEDPTRPLNKVGITTSEKMAKWLGGSNIEVDEIRHSGKKRAEQTALIFASFLSPQWGVSAMPGLQPMDDVRPIADVLRTVQRSLMLVGHLPFMNRLVSLLVVGDSEKKVIRFKNSGVICLQEEEGQWNIKWVVIPDLVNGS